MPTRMPKTFKGYPPGVDPKSVRVVRRAGTAPRSTFMQDLGFTSKNMIKTRVLQGGFWHACCGTVLLIMTIVADSQYGFARRFAKELVGVSLINLCYAKCCLELFLALYIAIIWYLSLIMSPCYFNFMALVLVAESAVSVWTILAAIMALLYNSNGSTVVTYSSGQRTMLIFLTLIACASAMLSLGFCVGIIRQWKDDQWRHRHSTAEFSSVVVAKHRAPPIQATAESSDDSSDSSDDEDARSSAAPPPVPSAPSRAVALPAPGAAGSQPVFYQAAPAPSTTQYMPQPGKAPPVPEQPVHDETTRAQFAHLWQSMKEVGNFSCGVSRVPALEEVVTHLRKHGFLPLMTGDNGTERKLYFYSEELYQGDRTMVFLAEFKFDVQGKTLDATFKSHTKTHIQKVRNFNLQELFQVVRK